MPKTKRIIEIAFVAVVVALVLIQAASLYLRWREGKRIREEIWKGARVTVVKTDPQFPPGLLVEYENTSRYTIGKTHFRLVFSINGLEVARTDRDYLKELKPGQKERILLKSGSTTPTGQAYGPPTKATYLLIVFPDMKKPLPMITGEIELR
jgi:hypothetical protein